MRKAVAIVLMVIVCLLIGFGSYTIGHNSGYQEGTSAGERTGLTRGTQEGYDKGYNDGKIKAYADGDAAGYKRAYDEAYAIVQYVTSISETECGSAVADAYSNGLQQGEIVGLNKGYVNGWNAAWSNGWQSGWWAGCQNCYRECYPIAVPFVGKETPSEDWIPPAPSAPQPLPMQQ